MFRVEFFVEDKNLAKIMHDLTGRVMDLQVKSVTNAIVAPTSSKSRDLVPAPTVQPKVEGRATTYMRVFERIRLQKVKGDRVTSVEIQDAMKDEKISDNTYSFIIRNLKENNLIGSLQRGIFVVKGN